MSEAAQTCEPVEVMVRPLIVDVYAYREGDEVLFAHMWKREGDSKKKKGRIEIPKGESAVPIHFSLHDRTGLHLSFFPDSSAIWVDVNDCPATGPGNDMGQISYENSGRNLLKIADANTQDCLLHFSLRFDGDPLGDQPPYEYDPELRNGGGG